MICCFSSLSSSNAPRRTKRRFEFLAFILLQLLVSCLSDGPAASKQQSLHQTSSSGGKKASEPEGLFSSQCFSGLKMHARLVSALESKFNAVQMTPIQALSCPVLIRSSCDALIRAPTGSGKTLAYAVPLVQKLQEREEAVGRKDGPYVMILTPTRELAVQTYEVISKLLRSFVWIVPGILTGGEKPKSEKARLRKGVNVLVVTPARLTYHIRNTNSLSLCKMETIVMDECDMLLDLGYARDIDIILDAITQASEKVKVGGRIQHILLSATLSPGVTKLANRSLYKPRFFSAGGGGGGGLTPLPPLSRSKKSKDCGEDGDEDDDNEQIQNSNDAGNKLVFYFSPFL